MKYEEALHYIHSFGRFPRKPSLERIRALCGRLGNPQERLRFIHVAGTNGKGSVSAMLASVLQEAGIRTGLFTSPFLEDFRERFRVNGEMIPEEELAQAVDSLRPHAEALRQEGMILTEFDFVTALGFCWFLQKKCEIVVLEVGLGGRFDATNVIPPPLASVITSISLDHTEVLGDTVGQIAREKSGIIKPGSLAVSSAGQPEEALAVIMEAAAHAGCYLYLANPAAAKTECRTLRGTRFSYGGETYEMSLLGESQIQNALLAVETIQALASRGISVTGEQLARGLAKTQAPARLEVLFFEPLVLLDGSHNPSGIRNLVDTVKALAPGKRVRLVFGMLADKDMAASAEMLREIASEVILIPPENARAAAGETLAPLFAGLPETLAENEEQAAELALRGLTPEKKVVVCGSLYLAGQLRPILCSKLKTKI